MRGDLRQSSVADVMRHAYAERKNGILHLSQQGVKLRVHFKKGAAIFADAADGQLPTRDQAIGLLYSLFNWTEGLFAFEDLEPNVDDAQAFTMSPSVVILEGSRGIADSQILEHLTGGPHSVFACTQTSELPLFTMKLSPAESAILKFARERERFTTQDLPFKSAGLAVVNALNALLSVGLLEIVEKATAPTSSPAPPVVQAAAAQPPPVVVPEKTTVPKPATSTRKEVESLLETFESKRPKVPTPSSKVQWSVSPPLPVIEAAVVPPEPIRPPAAKPPAPVVAATPPPPRPKPPPAATPPPPVAKPVSAPPQPQRPKPVPPRARDVRAVPAPPPVPSDVADLLETFEAKRSGAPVPQPKQRAPAAVAPEPVTEVVSVLPDPVQPDFEPDPPPAPLSEAAPEPEPVVEPRRTKEPPVDLPPRGPSTTPSSVAKASLLDFVSRWIPMGKARTIAVASLAFVIIGGIAAAWLSSRGGETAPSSAVAAADSTPPRVESVEPVPPPKDPEPEPEAEPSDAELFYSANLAFENGEYERSKAELVTLLERRPDFGAARELMARIDRELAPKPRVPERTRAPRRVVHKTLEPEPKPEPQPVEPPAPDEAALFDDARSAFARGDLETTREKLDELGKLDAAYPGAWKLREQLAERFWERKLPLVITVRHDHALGGCDGVMTLTKTGFGYRSDRHEWVWSFAEITATDRRDANRLRIETRAHASFNFELREQLSKEDWTRHQALGNR